MKISVLFTLAVTLLAFLPAQASCGDKPGVQRAARLDTQVKVEMDYQLYLPADYEKQDAWPLVLFLHGSGERGSDLEKVKIHGPPKLVAAGKQFPFILVSPQCPDDQTWEPIKLLGLLDDLGRKYKVDADRVYVTGLSMGGSGAWRLAAYAPDRFAAIAPICGGGEGGANKRLAHLPVWFFQGALDEGGSLDRTMRLVIGLKKNGGTPKLTIYPEGGHDVWTETYNNPELYTWLLAQKRTSKK